MCGTTSTGSSTVNLDVLYINPHWEHSFSSPSNKEILIRWTMFSLSLKQWPTPANIMAFLNWGCRHLHVSHCISFFSVQSNENYYLHKSYTFTWGNKNLFFLRLLSLMSWVYQIFQISVIFPKTCSKYFMLVCMHACMHVSYTPNF